MADLLVEEPAVVRARLGVGLARLHVVDIGAVLVGDDRLHPLDLQRLADIDLLDIGVGVGAAKDHHRVVAGLDPVLDEGGFTGDEDGAVDLALRLADVGEVVTEGGGDLALVGAGLHPFAGKLDRRIVLLIAAVADEEAAEDLLDLFSRRLGVMLEEPGEQEGGSRCVVGALHHPAVDHRLLYCVEVPAIAQTLGGPDRGPIGLDGERQVCIDGNIVEQDGVAPDKALAVIAVANTAVAELDEDRTEGPVIRNLEGMAFIVYCQSDGTHRAPPLRNSPKSCPIPSAAM